MSKIENFWGSNWENSKKMPKSTVSLPFLRLVEPTELRCSSFERAELAQKPPELASLRARLVGSRITNVDGNGIDLQDTTEVEDLDLTSSQARFKASLL